jgi:hypothetical protein
MLTNRKPKHQRQIVRKAGKNQSLAWIISPSIAYTHTFCTVRHGVTKTASGKYVNLKWSTYMKSASHETPLHCWYITEMSKYYACASQSQTSRILRYLYLLCSLPCKWSEYS